MKPLFVVFSLILGLGLSQAQFITSQLRVALDARVGVTTTTNLPPWSSVTNGVLTWEDRHNTYNNDGVTNTFSQANPRMRPVYSVDEAGMPCLEFQWLSTNALTCSTVTGIDAANVTMYVVCQSANSVQVQTILLFPTFPFPLMKTQPIGLTASRESALFAPLNKSVLITQNDNGVRAVVQWNHQQYTASSLGSIALNGLDIGGESDGQMFYGRLYAVYVYSASHTDAQMGQMVTWCATNFGVVTNYDTQAWCVGDSITIGTGSANLQSWPMQLAQKLPNILWYNAALGGVRIGTNGDGAGASIFGNAPTYIDPRISATMHNWLLFKAGVNDLHSDGLSGQSLFGRMTNYIAYRRTAGWTDVGVLTLAADGAGGGPTFTADCNALLRTYSAPGVHLVDGGQNSPTDSRLNDYLDSRYFWVDGLHLTNGGYTVHAEHAQMLFNQPRRATGFW